MPNQSNVLMIYHNNAKYMFIIQDLIKIINTSLTNAPYFFLVPLQCKNPYTNIPFNNAILYYIYFEIKHRVSVIPQLFHRFFLCNFNKYKFRIDNEDFIKEIAIDNHINNLQPTSIFTEIVKLLKGHKFTKKLFIHKEFPIQKLTEICKPFLKLQYQSLYCVGSEKSYLNVC